MNSTCLKWSQYNMDSDVHYLLYHSCTFSTLFYLCSILHFKAVVMRTARSNVPLKAATIFFYCLINIQASYLNYLPPSRIYTKYCFPLFLSCFFNLVPCLFRCMHTMTMIKYLILSCRLWKCLPIYKCACNPSAGVASIHRCVCLAVIPHRGWRPGTLCRYLHSAARPRPGPSRRWTRTRVSRCAPGRWPSQPRGLYCWWSCGP